MIIFLIDRKLINSFSVDSKMVDDLVSACARLACKLGGGSVRVVRPVSSTPVVYALSVPGGTVKTAYHFARLCGAGRDKHSAVFYSLDGKKFEKVRWREMTKLLDLNVEDSHAPSGGLTSMFVRYRGGMFLPGNPGHPKGKGNESN